MCRCDNAGENTIVQKQKTCPFGQVRFRILQYGSSNKRCLFVHETELLLETIYTSAGIHEFLLAREKRMALGANFNTDIALGRTGLDYLAAGTSDRSLLVVGVDSFLHRFHLSSRVKAAFSSVCNILQQATIILSYPKKKSKCFCKIFSTFFIFIQFIRKFWNLSNLTAIIF